MSSRFQLHGSMIPRTVKRVFDERVRRRGSTRNRARRCCPSAGRNHVVTLVNLSRSGAMVRFGGDAHIGESVSLQLLDRGTIAGQVRWLRDGRMGVYFAAPLE